MGLNRWQIYSSLKQEKLVDINDIEKSKDEEVKEGLIEYLMMRNKEIESNLSGER